MFMKRTVTWSLGHAWIMSAGSCDLFHVWCLDLWRCWLQMHVLCFCCNWNETHRDVYNVDRRHMIPMIHSLYNLIIIISHCIVLYCIVWWGPILRQAWMLPCRQSLDRYSKLAQIRKQPWLLEKYLACPPCHDRGRHIFHIFGYSGC